MKSASRFALVAALLLTAGAARAAPPFTFTYSGYLTDSTGAPATASTTLDLQFYDAGTAGILLGHEYAVGVTPNSDGYFSVIVGTNFVSNNVAAPTFDTLFAFPTFMAVKYGADASYMTTRVPLTSVPSAMSVAWSGVKGFPAACSGATPVLQGFNSAGAPICVADANSVYTATAPLTLTGGAFGIAQASGTMPGYLSAADWNTFNGKVGAVAVTTAGGLANSGTGTVPALGLAACGAAGSVMTWNGTSWGCAAGATGTVTGVTGNAPITSTGGTAPAIGITQATSASSGYLASTDFNAFNAKVGSVGATTAGGVAIGGTAMAPTVGLTTACSTGQVLKYDVLTGWGCAADANSGGTVTGVTGTAPIVSSGGATPAISITQATGTTNGYVSSTDWTAFNNKVGSVAATANGGVAIGGTATAPTVGLAACGQGQVLKTTAAGWVCAPAMTKTVVTYSGTHADTAPSTTLKWLADLGTFSKVFPGTTIEVQWHSHATAAGHCDFQLRVDGVASPASDWGAVSENAGATPISTTNVFTGLLAGVHTVSVWTRGVAATNCTENSGNYGRSFVVTEF